MKQDILLLLDQDILEEQEEYSSLEDRNSMVFQADQNIDKDENGEIKKRKMYSIKQLLSMDFGSIGKKVFKLKNIQINQEQIHEVQVKNEDDQQKSQNAERYVQIKMNETLIENNIEFVIQIIDFSLNIVNQKVRMANNLENLIRGTVCHEMQNPLNSIINGN